MDIVSKYIDGCGILGILRRDGSDKVPGDLAITAMQPAKPRGAGLGAGFAVFNDEGGPLRLGVFSRGSLLDYVDGVVRDWLARGGFTIVSSGVRAELNGIVDLEYVVDGVDNINDLTRVVNGINDELWRNGRAGRVYYWGRYVTVFKGVGYSEDVAEVYDISKVSGDLWLAHVRFPTNSPGYLPYWSHPFSVGNIAVVHNGELSSYGLQATQLSLYLGIQGLVGTDSEVVAYLMHYLVNVVGLGIIDSIKLLIGGDAGSGSLSGEVVRKLGWVSLDGPFAIAMGVKTEDDLYLIAIADRFKLRPIVVGYDEYNYYVASEEAQIRAISPRARVWTLEPGGYFIASLRRGIIAWGRPVEQVEVFFPERSFPRYVGGDAIDAYGLSYREINEEILRRVLMGQRVVRVVNVNGQRYIGNNLPRYGVKGVTVEIYGTPGNAMANLNSGVDFIVYGNVQDDVGDTMHGGSIVVHGDARDVVGQALQGGYIFIRGNAGNRVGIQMREYVNKRPYLIIGGRVDDYLGEYMAGGVIMVLGIDAYLMGRNIELVGRYVGSGMVGGRIYIRGRVDEGRVGLSTAITDTKVLEELLSDGQGYGDLVLRSLRKLGLSVKPNIEYRELEENEVKELMPVLLKYAEHFNLGRNLIEELLGLKYTVITKPPLGVIE
jgi:glutamate synthase domain-containing protein 3/glutamate synthase domain-containing protein 1